MKRRIMQKTVIGIISLLLLPMVLAGISYNPNPIKLAPGESKEILINLQNSEDKTVVLLLQWIEGEKIAKIMGDTKYTIPPRSYDTYTKIKVSIPQNANPGDAYKIKLQINTAPEGSNQIEITKGYFVEIPVIVVAESQQPQSPSPQEQPVPTPPTTTETLAESSKQNKTLIAAIAVILIALVVLVIVLMRKKK